MDNLGAEVGQKMRSAIKAKLTELDCYVDDELPDYVMVMVANKRTKSQMNEDLQLFLAKKTSIFVDWLHIVLKKLKEVTVTNPEVYKKVAKRKSTELIADIKFKKEKIHKKEKSGYAEMNQPSLTDDLPININKNSEKRKVVFESDESHDKNIDDDNFDIPLLSEVNISNEEELAKIERKISIARRLGMVVEDDELTNSEDLVENQNPARPSIVSKSTEGEVDPSFEKISFPTKTPKNKISVHDRISANESTLKSEPEKSNLEKHKSTPEEKRPTSGNRTVREKITFDDVPKSDEYEKEESSTKEITEKSSESKRQVSDRITFNSEDHRPSKKRSVLERLGRRLSSTDSTEFKKRKSSVENEGDFFSRNRLKEKKETESSSGRQSEKYSRDRKFEEQKVKLRPGIQSKVSLPPKEEKIKDVPSVIKITPRKIPPDAQPNKFLLLKAVAEAQKSVTQSQTSRNNKHNGLFTESYRKTQMDEANEKMSPLKKYKMKNIVVKVTRDQVSSSSEDEKPYIPKSVNKTQIKMTYTPTSKFDSRFSDKQIIKENISVTLTSADADDSNVKNKEPSNQPSDPAVAPQSTKRSFSPIVFDDVTSQVKARVNVPDVKTRINVPDNLPAVKLSPLLKNKERCKFWPNCRQGDKCEFIHPTATCELFPNCKFGDKCVYLHPICKFSTSCTKRDCPYYHSSAEKNIDSATSNLRKPSHASSIPVCKFFPNCTKINCFFYHPRPCKYGKYCKSPDCTYLHHSKNNLTWRSNK